MERVKDLNGLIIQDDYVLIKIVEKKSSILQAENSAPMIDYSVVVKVGDNVKKVKVDDIILRMTTVTLEVHEYKGVKYSIIPEGFIKIAVHPDNFKLFNKSDLSIN